MEVWHEYEEETRAGRIMIWVAIAIGAAVVAGAAFALWVLS